MYSRYESIIRVLSAGHKIFSYAMDSDRTTPTRGSSITDSDQDLPDDEQIVKKKCGRKILFDDFEIFGDVVFSRHGVIVQAKREDRLHSGTLQITETKQGTFVTWERDANPVTDSQGSKEKISESGGVEVGGGGEGGGGGGGDRKKIMINDQGTVAFCVGSPPPNDWAVIADNSQQPATPIGESGVFSCLLPTLD